MKERREEMGERDGKEGGREREGKIYDSEE